MKTMLKSELARAAGVSYPTFNRWLTRHRDKLCAFGLAPRAQLIPASVVRWICQEYGIDEEEL